MSELNQVTDVTFENEIVNHKGYALLDFWAPWCGPCKMLMPTLEALAPEYEGRVKFNKLNVDENTQVPEKFGVRGIPQLTLFKDGVEIATATGAKRRPQLIEFLEKHIAHEAETPVEEEDDFLSGIKPQDQDYGICESCQ